MLHNLPAGDWSAGERGIGCLPDRVDEFKAGVQQAIAYATALGCTRVNCLAGKLPAGLDPAVARDTLIANLRYAAPRFKDAGIALLVEPINTRDVPGFFLSGTQQAIDIIDAAGSDNLWLQYDIYHMQIMEGDVAPGDRASPSAHQAHAAGRCARTARASTGEIDFPSLLAAIDRLGYAGWIGCEYVPKTETIAGLGWATPYL